MYFSLVLFLVILIISYVTSKENFFSPAVLTSGIWFMVILLYIFFGGELNVLTSKFLTAINIWVSLFCLSSLFVQSLDVKKSKVAEPSKLTRDILFYFSIATFPLLVYQTYKIFSLGSPSEWFSLLRMAATGGLKEISIEDTNPFYVVVWLISYFFELYFLDKKNKNRVVVLFVLYFLFGIFSMGKTHILTLFLGTIYILSIKRVIKTKHILISVATLILIFISIQTLRFKKNAEMARNQMVELYLLSPAPAFEKVTSNSTKQFGENVFRIYYSITYKLGFNKIEPVDTILEFVDVGVGTNTYTIMYPYYKDFGLKGIAVFALIIGVFIGYVFKKAQKGNVVFVIIYSMFLYEIAMQFAGDMFFTNLTLNLKRIIIAFIPFFITRYELFVVNKKNKNEI